MFETTTEYLYPSDLAEEYYHVDTLPLATEPVPFVGFQCFCCGERHANLEDVLLCHKWIQKFWTRGLVKVEEKVAV